MCKSETAAAEQVSRYVWYSLFQWAADQPDRFCGEFHERCGAPARMRSDVKMRGLPTLPSLTLPFNLRWLEGRFIGCKHHGKPTNVYPFASGGLDLRSRALIKRTKPCMRGLCQHPAPGACDATTGLKTWSCLESVKVVLADLTWRKWSQPSRMYYRSKASQFREPWSPRTYNAQLAHTTVVHGAKELPKSLDCRQGAGDLNWTAASPALAPVLMLARRRGLPNQSAVEWRVVDLNGTREFQSVFDVEAHPNPCSRLSTCLGGTTVVEEAQVQAAAFNPSGVAI